MNTHLSSKIHQSLLISLIIVGGTFTLIGLQIPHLTRLNETVESPNQEVWQQKLDLTKNRLDLLKKAPTFGFDNLVANWTFLDFVGYFGDEQAREVTGYQLSPKYFEVIVEKDPRFVQAYPFLFSSSVTYAGMPQESLALMEKGLKSMTPQSPNKSYYIWRYKAFTELLFVGDSPAAQKSYAKAAEWASTYPDPISQNVAYISRRTAEFLAANPDSKSAQISSWLGVLETAVDEKIRAKAIQRIKELGGKIEITNDGSVKVQLPR